MNVHQMSVTYVPEQDRILLRISTTEGEDMRLWLTRRLMLGLWPALHRAVPAGTRPQAQAVNPAAGFEVAQADTQETPVAQLAPLPAGPEPLLVGEVQLTPPGPGSNGRLRIHFREKPGADAPQHGFQLQLTPQLSRGLLQLLDRALRLAQWGLGSAAPAGPAEADFAPDEDRPKYLN